MPRDAGLKRALGLPALAFYGLGCILGAGVYSVIGVAARHAGESLWLSFLLASVAAGLTGLSYVELATMMPKSAAEYVYARAAFPRLRALRFAAGGLVALSDVATAATVSIAFAGYAGQFVDVPTWLPAGALIVGCATLAAVGIHISSKLNVVFTLIEAAGLVVVVAVGAARPEFGRAILAAPPVGVVAGAALLFYAYLGFEGIANLGEEAKDPARDLPRAVLISLAAATVLYVAVGLAVVALLPVETLTSSDRPLADAVAAASPGLAGALGGVALFATANTALIACLVASRVLFGMARGGDLPRPLAVVSKRTHAPWIAAVVVGLSAAAVATIGELEAVASVSSVGALCAFAMVNASLIALRLRAPRRKRPFRVPLSVGKTPVLPVLGLLASLALATQFERSTYVAAAIAVGVLAAAFVTRPLWARQGRQ